MILAPLQLGRGRAVPLRSELLPQGREDLLKGSVQGLLRELLLRNMLVLVPVRLEVGEDPPLHGRVCGRLLRRFGPDEADRIAC